MAFGSSGFPLELEDKGMPARRLRALAVSHGLLAEVEKLASGNSEELRTELAMRELPFAILTDRQELAACLTAILLWERLPPNELVAECRRWGIVDSLLPQTPSSSREELDFFIHKCQLVRSLATALWMAMGEARGIPVPRLAPPVALALMGKVLRLEGSSEQMVEAEYKRTLRRLGIPAEPDAGKHYYSCCLITLLVWQELEQDALRALCKDQQIDPVELSLDRQELAKLLLVGLLCRSRWEARGIPVTRLGVRAALRVAQRWETLEGSDEAALRAELQRLSIILPPQSSRSALLQSAKAMAVWTQLSQEELQAECKTLGVSITAEDCSPSRLVKLLAERLGGAPTETHCLSELGLPLRRLQSPDEVGPLLQRVGRLRQLEFKELLEEYTKTGLTKSAGPPPDTREELLSRLQQLEIWRALPISELRRECQELNVGGGGLPSAAEEAEKRRILIDRLIMCSWAEAWECQGIPIRRLSSVQAAARFAEQDERLQQLAEEDLAAEVAALTSLPSAALKVSSSRGEVLEKLRQTLLWKELSLEELRDECLQLSVSWRTDPDTSGPHQREELFQRLAMAQWAAAWEDRGVPVKQLATLEAALKLLERWGQLETMGLKDLQEAYSHLGLPKEAPTPKVLDYLPRLRQFAIWEVLPLWELQKECRQVAASTAATTPPASDRAEALLQLVLNAWGPLPKPADDSPKTKPGQDGGAAPQESPMLQSIVAHFQTLGLPPTAGVDELKKAYRRLSLQHHPDKNRNVPQEKAAEKFRMVAEAYEAVQEFMKMKS